MKKARDPDLIRERMQVRDLTQRELALIARCPLVTIHFILNGKSTSSDVARRMARALRSRVDDLFQDAPTSREQHADQREAVA